MEGNLVTCVYTILRMLLLFNSTVPSGDVFSCEVVVV